MHFRLKNIVPFLFFITLSLNALAQKARVKGVILDEFKNPVENVSVTENSRGTTTNKNGNNTTNFF